MAKTREQLLFLNTEDETSYFASLVEAVPDVCLIAGSRWPSPLPPVVGAPAESHERINFLWSPSVRSDLPSRPRGDHFDGPSTGWVIQWVRSPLLPDGELRSGRLAASWDPSDAAMREFVSAVWKTLMGITTNKLTRLDGVADTDYRVGEATTRAARAGEIRLRDGSVPLYFEVPA